MIHYATIKLITLVCEWLAGQQANNHEVFLFRSIFFMQILHLLVGAHCHLVKNEMPKNCSSWNFLFWGNLLRWTGKHGSLQCLHLREILIGNKEQEKSSAQDKTYTVQHSPSIVHNPAWYSEWVVCMTKAPEPSWGIYLCDPGYHPLTLPMWLISVGRRW